MTAFERAGIQGDWGSAILEIRTVNHRYLDISLRMPDDLRMFEPFFRETIQNKISRGKVDCTLRFNQDEHNSSDLPLDTELAGKVIRAAASLPITRPDRLNPLDILRWPGVINREPPDMALLEVPVRELLNRALTGLIDTRLREGEKLREMILERCADIIRQIEQIKTGFPAIIPDMLARYRQRAHDLIAGLDENRLEQELVMLAQKMDIAEELDRLEAHISEVKRVLDQDEPVGRRLDFLMQELHREANTLSSKSVNIGTSNAAIELKVLIEQMREQTQNIE